MDKGNHYIKFALLWSGLNEIKYIVYYVTLDTVEEIYRQVGNYWKLIDEVFRRIVERIELDFL